MHEFRLNVIWILSIQIYDFTFVACFLKLIFIIVFPQIIDNFISRNLLIYKILKINIC